MFYCCRCFIEIKSIVYFHRLEIYFKASVLPPHRHEEGEEEKIDVQVFWVEE